MLVCKPKIHEHLQVDLTTAFARTTIIIYCYAIERVIIFYFEYVLFAAWSIFILFNTCIVYVGKRTIIKDEKWYEIITTKSLLFTRKRLTTYICKSLLMLVEWRNRWSVPFVINYCKKVSRVLYSFSFILSSSRCKISGKTRRGKVKRKKIQCASLL